MKRGAPSIDMRDWYQHLFHLMNGKWAERRCAICHLQDLKSGKTPHLSQFHLQPPTSPMA